jgi:hypothetical protein
MTSSGTGGLVADQKMSHEGGFFFLDMMNKKIDINEMTPEELILCEKEASLNFWSLNYARAYEVSNI